MKRNITKLTGLIGLIISAISISACTASATATTTQEVKESKVADHSVSVVLSDNSSTASNSGITIEGNTLTITTSGTYTFTGSLTDGCIVVNCEDGDVELVLNGCNITNSDGPAIYSVQGDMSIEVASGTVNNLSDGAVYGDTFTETGEDGCIYGSDRVTIKGDGQLNVTGNYKDGIAGSDEVKINGSTLTITAVNNGIKGKDYVELNGGTVSITTQDDGIKSSKGYVTMTDGSYTINVTGKGINCETDFNATGGTLNITSGDDSINANNNCTIDGGTYSFTAGDDGIHADNALVINAGTIDVSRCYEGLEGLTVTINGGDIKIDASDDGINASAGSETIEAVTTEGVTEGTTGETTNEMPQMPEGNMPQPPEGMDFSGEQPPEPPEGFEMPSEPPTGDGAMASPQMGRGHREFTPPTDGTMPEGTPPTVIEPDTEGESRSTEGGFGGRHPGGFGGMMMDVNEDCVITVNGGTVYINAQGDGIDSNGSIVFNGGTVVVSGPSNSGNGALDKGTTISYNGGTLIAYGMDGMAEIPDADSEKYTVNWYGLNIEANTLVTVTDDDGNVIAAFTPVKNISAITVVSESISEGDILYINTGGTYTGELSDAGYGVGGTVTGQTQVGTITVTEKSSSGGTRSFGFGGGFERGSRGGRQPGMDKATQPTTEQ